LSDSPGFGYCRFLLQTQSTPNSDWTLCRRVVTGLGLNLVESADLSGVTAPTLRERAVLASRGLHIDLNNFFLLQYRTVDGYMITGKNSGTHWLKFMLSHAIAEEFNLPPPLHSSGAASDDFIGHPKRPQKYPGTPRIGPSHNLPSSLLSNPTLFHALRLPPVVVLVRDPKEAMLSAYVKWRDELDLTLADYVMSRPHGKRRIADIWWYIEFFNRWGQMATQLPDEVIIVRYEDLQDDPAYWLRRVLQHYGVEISDRSIGAAIKASGKNRMRRLLDPDFAETIIPVQSERDAVSLSPLEEATMRAVLETHLKYSFGYGYAAGNRPMVISRPDVAAGSAAEEAATIATSRSVG
jgi:hypothetical protein